ncbi:MAG: hypothetical protein HXS40_02235 [Theionarchaea archaeon]|nr:hypothetical protein [Theionarchaea archaeon]
MPVKRGTLSSGRNLLAVNAVPGGMMAEEKTTLFILAKDFLTHVSVRNWR